MQINDGSSHGKQVFAPPPHSLRVSNFIYMTLIPLILTIFQSNLIVCKT